MQTWEYAPQYALRTYAYLLPMAGLAKCLQFILKILPTTTLRHLLSGSVQRNILISAAMDSHDDKPLLFAMLRSSLALISCYSELSFLSSIYDIISPNSAHFTALCSFTAAGNFHANQAFLPSSSVMILWRLSAADQLRGYDGCAIFWGLVAVLAVGWPFCAVLFIPTGLCALWKAAACVEQNDNTMRFRSMAQVLIRTALHALIIQALVMMIDYYYYGRIVSPIWNIFMYNATAGGDELYGVEPLSYYMKNLLLNFNVVSLLGVISLPLVLGRKLLATFFPQTFRGGNYSGDSDGWKILMLIPMNIWLSIVFPRPHKEERFLFPIYPMLCFGAAIALEEIVILSIKVLSLIRPKLDMPSTNKVKLIGAVILAPFAGISISRAFALHYNYSAPIELYQYFFYHHMTTGQPHIHNKTIYICTAGEWYRFPSSFFLPPNTQLGFLKSSFAGQLPQPFTEFGSREKSLTIHAGNFNDKNREEMDRYVGFNECSFLVELVPSRDSPDEETPECLQYMKSDPSDAWVQVASYNYLDAMSTEALHRIVYIPFKRMNKVRYKGYNLYRSAIEN